jgi:hypothetical protein
MNVDMLADDMQCLGLLLCGVVWLFIFFIIKVVVEILFGK